MRKFGEFLKGFFAIILIIIAFAFVNVFLALESTSKLFSKDTVKGIIKEVTFTEFAGENSKQELYDELEEFGLPKESFDALLENEKFQEIVGEIISESLIAIIEDEKIPTIDEKKLTGDLIDVFDIVVEENNINISQKEINEVHQNIKENVSEIAKEMNISNISLDNLVKDEGTNEDDTMATIRDGLEIAQSAYKNRIWCLVIAIVLLGVVILLKLKDLKFLKWIGSTLICYAITFVVMGKLVIVIWEEFIVKELEQYGTLLSISVNEMIKTYYIAGIIFFIIGVGLIAIKPICSKYKEKDEMIG